MMRLLGGRVAEVDLGALLAKRGSILATSLRSRSPEAKVKIVSEVKKHLWPSFNSDSPRPIRSIIQFRRYPLEEALNSRAKWK